MLKSLNKEWIGVKEEIKKRYQKSYFSKRLRRENKDQLWSKRFINVKILY